VHHLHDMWRSDRSRAGKPLKQRADPEPVIAVAVGDVDGLEVLPTGLNRIHQDVVLVDGHEGIEAGRKQTDAGPLPASLSWSHAASSTRGTGLELRGPRAIGPSSGDSLPTPE
jgi:hypothetical protein